ncbi:MAG: hypothetical protein MZV64_42380 [Ignavibacteriales bacterium]|nr:hypothetical protein [Ignavibacteriales bacterium]
MMNPRSRPGDLDRRVDHHRQHVVEHAAGPERAQAFEQRRRSGGSRPRPARGACSESDAGGRRTRSRSRRSGRGGCGPGGAARAPSPARRSRRCRTSIPCRAARTRRASERDFGVVARDIRAGQIARCDSLRRPSVVTSRSQLDAVGPPRPGGEITSRGECHHVRLRLRMRQASTTAAKRGHGARRATAAAGRRPPCAM